jgi:flavorubredoxin
VDGRISWFAPEARGFAPLNSYLLLEDDAALLVDTGVPVHERLLVEQLRSLLPDGVPLSILHTRIVEFDSVGNTAALVREFALGAVYANFPAYQWIHFHPKWDRPGVEPDDLWPADKPRDCRVARPGEVIPVGSGGRTVEIVAAPLRLLATYWPYDSATRTLFTSDSFGHALMRSPDGPRVLVQNDVGYEELRDHLVGKFDWLSAADTRPLREQLRTIFETHHVETIGPGFGRVLRGRKLVERHLAMVDRALLEASAAPAEVAS